MRYSVAGVQGKLWLFWRRFWTRFAGRRGLGRLAARLAAWGTMPFHGRAFLADMHRRGFIAPSSACGHPDLRLGAHVYIGDGVVAFRSKEGGPVELQDGVQLYGNTSVQTGAGGSITIGTGTHIQPGCWISAYVSDITIGRVVEIASGCAFYSYDHGTSLGVDVMRQPLRSKGSIVVGDGAWLGHGVIVLDGVRIGAGAVVGAGSVVIRDIPENAIAAGVPARVLKMRESVGN